MSAVDLTQLKEGSWVRAKFQDYSADAWKVGHDWSKEPAGEVYEIEGCLVRLEGLELDELYLYDGTKDRLRLLLDEFGQLGSGFKRIQKHKPQTEKDPNMTATETTINDVADVAQEFVGSKVDGVLTAANGLSLNKKVALMGAGSLLGAIISSIVIQVISSRRQGEATIELIEVIEESD